MGIELPKINQGTRYQIIKNRDLHCTGSQQFMYKCCVTLAHRSNFHSMRTHPHHKQLIYAETKLTTLRTNFPAKTSPSVVVPERGCSALSAEMRRSRGRNALEEPRTVVHDLSQLRQKGCNIPTVTRIRIPTLLRENIVNPDQNSFMNMGGNVCFWVHRGF